MDCYVLFAMKENFIKHPVWLTRVSRAVDLATAGNFERIRAGDHTLIIQIMFAPDHSPRSLLDSLNSPAHPLEAPFVLMEYGLLPQSNLPDWDWIQRMKNRAFL